MLTFNNRKRRLKKVTEGDGHALKSYRFWHVFTHSLFHIHIINDENEKTNYALKSRYFAENASVDLYYENKHIASSTLPAVIPMENGILEVKSGGSGINKINYITDKDEMFFVYPDKRSVRGLRLGLHQRFPKISSFIALLATLVLLMSVVLSLSQLLEPMAQIPWVAENIGTIESPVKLSVWANIAVGIAAAIAATERALMLRSHWIIDMGAGG